MAGGGRPLLPEIFGQPVTKVLVSVSAILYCPVLLLVSTVVCTSIVNISGVQRCIYHIVECVVVLNLCPSYFLLFAI